MAVKKAIVIGSSGMLGQQVLKTFSNSGFPFVSFARGGKDTNEFVFTGQSSDEIVSQLNVGPGDYIVNCIGWIPQISTSNDSIDRQNAKLLNVDLPEALEGVSKSHGARVLQVTTDCVFSGTSGKYFESSNMDSRDIYGASKIQGERKQPSAMRIRASIVGPDANSTRGLFSWYLGQSAGACVTGYTNHRWNGVSTLALSKLFLEICRRNYFKVGAFHWLPVDAVSKYELLLLFKKFLGKNSALVKPGDAITSLDRTLATVDADFNRFLWELAGYAAVPTIEQLVAEFVNPALSPKSSW